MFGLSRKEVEELREKYPNGTRIRLIYMSDPYRPVPSGTKGTVRYVDDAGDIQMSWDNGQGLALVPHEDQFETIKD